MAVINDYVDSIVAAGKLTSFGNAKDVFIIPVTFEVAAADSDGSIYRILKNVDPNLILIQARLACDAITGGTSYDFGVYLPLSEGGAEVDANCFASAMNISAGYSRILALDALVTLDLADVQKRIYEVAGHTLATRKRGYDLALTANTVGSGAGTISMFLTFAQGY